MDSSTPRHWHLILRGGCVETCPSTERQSQISHNLDLIAQVAVEELEHGAAAKEVVVKGVSALEDCPLFNAGKGAAFTKDGTHEVIPSTPQIHQFESQI